MVGRAAYHSPSDILCAADARIYGGDGITDPHEVVLQMLPYIDRHIASGGRLHQVTRHMLACSWAALAHGAGADCCQKRRIWAIPAL